VPHARVRLPGSISWDELRAELQVPTQFPPGVLAEAEEAARSPRLPDLDLTELPFLTIDPAGSLDLDETGELRTTNVQRARVRSTRRLEYGEVQRAIDAGTADEQLALLAEIGRKRQALAQARGAVDLPTPEQEVTDGPDGRPCLQFRAPVAAEGWNAQISLLTGIAAAGLMIEGKIGLLRTLPPPDQDAVASLRRSAVALGVAWPKGASYGEVISGLDPADPGAAALLTLSTRLLRGAAYTAFDGEVPKQAQHSAVAAAYAHCTAPLRRLADRYVSEICLALCAGADVPEWVRTALPALPDEMAAADKRAHEIDRAIVDLTEAVVLAPRVGETFTAVVVDSGPKGGAVQLTDPAVRARCEGADLPLGEQIQVRLEQADPTTRTVTFRRA
jgi:exoribonuclease R